MSESLNICCAYTGDICCIFTLNMKFLCLTMRLGGLYTDNTDANNAARQLSMIYALRHWWQMSQKQKKI